MRPHERRGDRHATEALMTSLQDNTTHASPAPLIAAITREIKERRRALKELEETWLAAFLARDLGRVRWLADCAAVHRKELALARAERSRYSSPGVAAGA